MKTRATRKFEVTVGIKSTVVCTETKPEAIERAVEKMYGARCFWFANHGLPGYGQVFEAPKPSKNNSNPGNTSRTCQVGIDVEPVGAPSPAFVAQQREDKKHAEQENILFGKCQDAYALGLNAGQDADPKPAATNNYMMDSEIDRGYDDGLEMRAEAIAEQKQVREDAAFQAEQAQREYMEQQINEARTEMDESLLRRSEHKKRISIEVARLQNLDFTCEHADEKYNAVVNGIAVETWEHGVSMGDWKREIRAGKHFGIVARYMKNTDWLSERLKNVVR